MGTHPIFESDFDCLTDMAVRKRNAKHDKQPSSKKLADKNERETNTRVKTIGIILGLVAIILFIKVQYTLVHSEMVSQTGDYRPGPAIVTTWKGVSREWATSWIEYHAALGFTRLFIFWDDPAFDRDTIDYLANDPVYSWVVDSYEPDYAYKEQYWMPNTTSSDFEQRVLPAYGVHADTEITARQSLYAVRAAQIGSEDGSVTWLLHIDADELFYVDKDDYDGGAAKVFENLSTRQFTHAAFFNDEIMPESARFVDKEQPQTPFHQRTLFKRNTAVTFDQTQRSHQDEWKGQKGVNFFMGYLCGKGAINLPEYRKRNPGAAVVAQHVVRFAADERNLELVTKLQEKKDYVHFEIPKDKFAEAAYFYGARIIHYINADLDSARAKFMFRETFDTKIFSSKLATDEVRNRYRQWEDKWTTEEGMPSDVYYNAMWRAVQDEKDTGGSQARDYYTKTSVMTDKRQRNRFMASGVIYRNERIRDYMNQIRTSINAGKDIVPWKV